jgi:hypothetical protein
MREVLTLVQQALFQEAPFQEAEPAPLAALPPVPPLVRATVPYLDEPWYC